MNGLTLSGITLGPNFDSGQFAYAADVPSTVTSTTVTPVRSNPNATAVVKLDGVEDTDGIIDLAPGANAITVEVTAGDETAIYTVTVTRASPSRGTPLRASLAPGELSASGGTGALRSGGSGQQGRTRGRP